MSATNTGDTKKVMAEAGKLKKIIAIVKKTLSKELLWVLVILLISIPATLIMSYLLWSVSIDLSEVFSIITDGHYPSFVILYIICAIGIYFSRIVASAIKVQFENKKQP